MLWFLPSPSLGDGLSTGPIALWIDNYEMAAVVKVVFIYNEYIWQKSTDELQTRIRKDSVGRTLQQTRTILIFVNSESGIAHVYLLQDAASITKGTN